MLQGKETKSRSERVRARGNALFIPRKKKKQGTLTKFRAAGLFEGRRKKKNARVSQNG